MKTTIKNILLSALMLLPASAIAQVVPMGNMYFQNQYIGNAAMAGKDAGLALHIAHQKQSSNMPGSPVMQNLSAQYGLNNKVGLGLKVENEKAGLIGQTRVTGTYAYHLPFDADGKQSLSFGVSFGVLSERLATEDIKGNVNDVNIGEYAFRDNYLDGDLGIAYTFSKLTLQAALPNLGQVAQSEKSSNSVNRGNFFAAAAYQFSLVDSSQEQLILTPKAVFRSISQLANVYDFGASLKYNKTVSLYGMYHSSNNASVGLGLSYSNFDFLATYTSSTAKISNYTNGNFEIALAYKLNSSIHKRQ